MSCTWCGVVYNRADSRPQAQWACFQRIYDEVFQSFQQTQAYLDVQRSKCHPRLYATMAD